MGPSVFRPSCCNGLQETAMGKEEWGMMYQHSRSPATALYLCIHPRSSIQQEVTESLQHKAGMLRWPLHRVSKGGQGQDASSAPVHQPRPSGSACTLGKARSPRSDCGYSQCTPGTSGGNADHLLCARADSTLQHGIQLCKTGLEMYFVRLL